MRKVSNRFYVTALEDGTTIRGMLNTKGNSLSQQWTTAGARPDWSDTANQPIIYLTLYKDDVLANPIADTFKWFYNHIEIEFDNNGDSTNFAGKFHKFKESMTIGGVSYQAEALKVTNNLASSENVDIDVISCEGQCEVGGSPLGFSAGIYVRITSVMPSSDLGIIERSGALTSEDSYVVLTGSMVNADGSPITGFTTMWYRGADDTTGESGGNSNSITIKQSEVDGRMVVRCEFTKNGESSPSAFDYIEILDDFDDMDLFIQFVGNNSNGASMRSGDAPVQFIMWVGKKSDQSVLMDSQTNTPIFNKMKVQLTGGGVQIGGPDDARAGANSGLSENIPAVDTDETTQQPNAGGWRTLGNGNKLTPDVPGKFTISINYSVVASDLGRKDLTGCVVATSEEEVQS